MANRMKMLVLSAPKEDSKGWYRYLVVDAEVIERTSGPAPKMGASGCVYKQGEKHLVRLEPRKKRGRPLQIDDIIVADLDGPEAWELNEALYE